jgi:uncharacterized protein YbjQ (UPF0145 family)
MGFFRWFIGEPDPALKAARETSARRQAEIVRALQEKRVAPSIAQRLQDAGSGKLPWIATLSPSELRITQSHGFRPIATVSATCWMQHGFPWLDTHEHGWRTALWRLQDEAKVAGANAVLDVRMRSIRLGGKNNMDFSLVGTAVRFDGLPPSIEPIVATVPALEFVKLLDADIVPTGIAVGADVQLQLGEAIERYTSLGNVECVPLSQAWNRARSKAHLQLRANARSLGNGVLAHVNFSEMFEDGASIRVRHVVIATTVDVGGRKIEGRIAQVRRLRGMPMPFDFSMALDMRAGKTPLARSTPHHQADALNDDGNPI